MFQNVSEGKSGLKSYITSPAWYSFNTKHKFQALLLPCSGMSRKEKMDLQSM